MNRMIWIPIAGTIAGVIAVALARAEREGTPYPLLNAPSPRTSRATPKPEPEPEKRDTEPKKPEPPVVRRYLGHRWRGERWADAIDDAVQEIFVELFREGGASFASIQTVTAVFGRSSTASSATWRDAARSGPRNEAAT